MSKVLIIGGGFAGLSAAVFLSKANHQVTVLEASPKLGGRAYSFLMQSQNDFVDNGQHILMGCYRNTLKFLSEIGAMENLYFQKSLLLNLIEKRGNTLVLGGNSRIYPFNLISALLSFPSFTLNDKYSLLKFFVKLPFISKNELKNLTVEDWLVKSSQTANSRKYFWDLLIVGALNTDPHKASAAVFLEILREIFFHGNYASTLIIPVTDLSNLYCSPTEEYLEKNGNKISVGEKVIEFKVEENKVVKVVTNRNEYTEFDYVISAVPLHSLVKIKNNGLAIPTGLKPGHSSILSVHLWIENFCIKKKFFGFIGSDFHWVFKNGKHFTLVSSNAGKFMPMSNEEIIKKTAEELKIYFPDFNKADIKNSIVIKEKRATFIPSPSFEEKRKNIRSVYSNLILAGDWTDTGLPSTIESAVKSGLTAAEIVNRNS